MPSTATKDERVTARVPKATRARLQQAADLSGATLNQFLVQSALKEADAIIERESVIRLTRQDVETFFAALERPPNANRKLRAAAQAYRRAAPDAAD